MLICHGMWTHMYPLYAPFQRSMRDMLRFINSLPQFLEVNYTRASVFVLGGCVFKDGLRGSDESFIYTLVLPSCPSPSPPPPCFVLFSVADGDDKWQLLQNTHLFYFICRRIGRRAPFYVTHARTPVRSLFTYVEFERHGFFAEAIING